MSISHDDLKKLKAPFDAKTLCVKVQSLSKNKDKAALVCYVQHTDAYNRIEEVDPAWSTEIMSIILYPAGENYGEYFSVRVKLTIKGVSRENTGEGQDPKSATSDAIKRAGMLFGIGRYLYDTEVVWVPYDANRDYYKTFTLDEYHAAMRPGQTRIPTQAVSSATPAMSALPKSAPQPLGRDVGKDPAPKPGVIVKPDPEAPAKRAACTEIFMAGKKIGKDLPALNDWIQEEFRKPLKDLTLEEMSFVLAELNRLYEGTPAEGDFQS